VETEQSVGNGVCCSVLMTAASVTVFKTPVVFPWVFPGVFPEVFPGVFPGAFPGVFPGDDNALLLHDCDEHVLLSSSNSSSLARGAVEALLEAAATDCLPSTSSSAAPADSLDRVLVEVAVVLLVTKKGLYALEEDELVVVVVVIRKGFAVVAVATTF